MAGGKKVVPKPILLVRLYREIEAEYFKKVGQQLQSRLNNEYHVLVSISNEEIPQFQLLSVTDVEEIDLEGLRKLVLDTLQKEQTAN